MSFEHSINFTRVQDISIRRSSTAIMRELITAEEDLRIEKSCTLVKLMLCPKLTITYPLHCDHTAMNLYNIMKQKIIIKRSSSSSSSSLEHIPERHGGRSYKKIKHIDFSIAMS